MKDDFILFSMIHSGKALKNLEIRSISFITFLFN
jgi:hypothetical protein